MEEEFDLCSECPCKNCTDEICFQAGCDGSRYGEGCISFNEDCPLKHKSLSNTPISPVDSPDTSTFDYSAFPAKTANILRLAENEIKEARQMYVCRVSSAVRVAHDALVANCDNSKHGMDVTHNGVIANCGNSKHGMGVTHNGVIANCDNSKHGMDVTHNGVIANCGNSKHGMDVTHNGVIANCGNSKHGNRGEHAFIHWCNSVGLKKDTAYRLLQVDALLSHSTPEEQTTLESASPSLLYAAAKPSAPAELVQAVKDGDITTHKQFKELEAQLKTAQEEQAKTKHQLEQAQRECESMRDTVIFRERELAEEADRADAAERRVLELESRPIDVAVQEPTPAEIDRLATEKTAQMTALLKAQILSLKEQLEDTNSQIDSNIDTIYSAASEFAVQAATTINGIRIAFWTLAKELSEIDFNSALEPLEQAVKQIYFREWEDCTDDWNNEMEEE